MIEKSYSLPSGTMMCQELGDPETAALTVVFVHGWLDNSASFTSLMQAMHTQSNHYHLVAIDLFGHGHSSHKAGSYYPFHDYIDDLHQLMGKLSPNRLVLVGHSLGALIASCYSAAFPEMVSGLIQIEGHGPLSEAPQATVSRLRDGVLSRQRQRRKPSRPLASLEDAIKLRSHANQIAPDLIAPVVIRGIAQFEGVWQWRSDPKLKCDSVYRMSQSHADAINAAIECPQLIILGNEGFKDLQHNRYKSTQNPPIIKMISGGHHCHLENPESVSELILGVVNKI